MVLYNYGINIIKSPIVGKLDNVSFYIMGLGLILFSFRGLSSFLFGLDKIILIIRSAIPYTMFKKNRLN